MRCFLQISFCLTEEIFQFTYFFQSLFSRINFILLPSATKSSRSVDKCWHIQMNGVIHFICSVFPTPRVELYNRRRTTNGAAIRGNACQQNSICAECTDDL